MFLHLPKLKRPEGTALPPLMTQEQADTPSPGVQTGPSELRDTCPGHSGERLSSSTSSSSALLTRDLSTGRRVR